MKKILILLGIFISSVIILGSNDEAIVKITAEFLAPLKIEVVQNANFGTVIAQNYSKGPSTNSGQHGKIKISGEGDIKIQWADINEGAPKDVENTEKLTVVLTNKDKSSLKLNSEFMLVRSEDEIKNITNLKLEESNPANLLVVGTLTNISSNTPSGIYEGGIIFRVEYTN